MSDLYQKHGWDTTRANVQTGGDGIQNREIAINDASGESAGSENGPELITTNNAGTTYYHFPSLERLDDTSSGNSGSSLIGIDSSSWNQLTGSNVQAVFDAADTLFNTTIGNVVLLTTNQTISGEKTFNDDMILAMGSQNYEITNNSNNLAIQGKTTATTSLLDLFSNDGDATDDVGLQIFGRGTPASTVNSESLSILFDSSEGYYSLISSSTGTGTLRPINISTSGNTYQLNLATDGNIGIGTNAPTQMLHLESSTADEPIVLIKNTNTSSGSPRIYFEHDSPTPADNDEIGQIRFYADDDLGASSLYAGIKVLATDVTNTSLDSMIEFSTQNSGSYTPILKLHSNDIEISNYSDTLNTTGQFIRTTSTNDFAFDAQGGFIFNIDANNDETTSYLGVRANASSTDLFAVHQDGKVAINDSTPGALLSIASKSSTPSATILLPDSQSQAFHIANDDNTAYYLTATTTTAGGGSIEIGGGGFPTVKIWSSDLDFNLTGPGIFNVADNTTDSFKVVQGTDSYLAVNTNNGTESIVIGNSLIDPNIVLHATDVTVNAVDDVVFNVSDIFQINATTLTDINSDVDIAGDLTIGGVIDSNSYIAMIEGGSTATTSITTTGWTKLSWAFSTSTNASKNFTASGDLEATYTGTRTNIDHRIYANFNGKVTSAQNLLLRLYVNSTVVKSQEYGAFTGEVPFPISTIYPLTTNDVVSLQVQAATSNDTLTHTYAELEIYNVE